MPIFIEFSAGRRGVNYPECRWCGREIHERDVAGEWFDGQGLSSNSLPGAEFTQVDHPHEPALEDGPRIGPFEHDYVQLTYESLKHDSETIAYFDQARGDWIICEPWTGAGEAYSDITISSGGSLKS